MPGRSFAALAAAATSRGSLLGPVTAPRARSAFIGYPVDRLLAVLDDPTDAARGAAALVAAGIPGHDITILRGDEGAARLDGTGAAHGRMERMLRLVSFTLMDQLPDMAWYEQAVRRGAAVVMVRVRGEDSKGIAVARLRANGAHFINHYGRFATEEIERWRGPEPDVPSLLKR